MRRSSQPGPPGPVPEVAAEPVGGRGLVVGLVTSVPFLCGGHPGRCGRAEAAKEVKETDGVKETVEAVREGRAGPHGGRAGPYRSRAGPYRKLRGSSRARVRAPPAPAPTSSAE
ncbi:hypothetical protein GCM10018779_36470 [Streptomyces griseocarneus]|nr:hypothetical protein GCM10018779_36470 [Streptomyces griseocarneus]